MFWLLKVNGHVVDLLMGAVETLSRVLVVLVSCPSHNVLPLADTLLYPLCGSDEVFEEMGHCLRFASVAVD